MSEYQYYEFQALDRPLGPKEMRQLRAISSRADITPTRFVNSYEWGDFKGNPAVWMERYFDAFLYVTNWGTHELSLRFPSSVLNLEIAAGYCCGNAARARSSNGFTILDFVAEERYDHSGVDDGSSWLPALLPLRADIARGDYRALYLGWLHFVQCEGANEDLEPPVPPGLRKPNPSLKALADFLGIDRDLVRAAAERSGEEAERPSAHALGEWIASLAGQAKDRWLLRVATGEVMDLRSELLRAYGEHCTRGNDSAAPTRTAGELWERASALNASRQRREGAIREREEARRAEEAAAARNRELMVLASREREAWGEVEALIARRHPDSYTAAVRLLVDLREVCARAGRLAEAEARLQDLRERHARKPTLLRRLEEAGLDGVPRLELS